jgi:hypothetical protein
VNSRLTDKTGGPLALPRPRTKSKSAFMLTAQAKNVANAKRHMGKL